MFAPIPLAALPDACTVKVPMYSADGYDGVVGYKQPVSIKHVRWERREAIKASQHVFADGSTGLMYVDRINSNGAFEIPVNSLVTIMGEERNVVSVTPARTLNGVVHHWEVELA